MTNEFPPTTVALPPMTHEKAIELLTQMRRNIENALSPDDQTAITLAITALIADKLNFKRGQL